MDDVPPEVNEARARSSRPSAEAAEDGDEETQRRLADILSAPREEIRGLAATGADDIDI